MTRQVVTTTPHNSGLGDPAYTAFEKLNANEAELYAAAGVTGASAISAATYAIARSLTGTTTGDRLQLLGRTTQSDGGQGLFTWVAGGSTTIDDWFELAATGGIWIRDGRSPLWLKIGAAIPYSSFSAGALTSSISLFKLPAGGVIHGIKIKHTVAFAGPSISAYSISVGIAGSNAKYASAFDVLQAVASNAFQLSDNFIAEDDVSTTQVTATATSVGANLSAANAGAVNIWALLSTAL